MNLIAIMLNERSQIQKSIGPHVHAVKKQVIEVRIVATSG